MDATATEKSGASDALVRDDNHDIDMRKLTPAMLKKRAGEVDVFSDRSIYVLLIR